MNEIPNSLSSASVKVMRSYDYCHFEVCLSISNPSFFGVDDLRKEAARLADKAVEQYKVAKRNLELMESDVYSMGRLEQLAKAAQKTPENERTPEEKAAIKAYGDRCHRRRYHYDYQDDYQEPDFDNGDAVGF